jgi:hypothetical protein
LKRDPPFAGYPAASSAALAAARSNAGAWASGSVFVAQAIAEV